MKKFLSFSIIIVVLLLFVIVFTNNMKGKTDSTAKSATYRDGMYIGSIENAVYGDLQVQAEIAGGKLVDITELKFPNDTGTSVAINMQALKLLKQAALQAQSAEVDIVSGASDSSPAFARSLKTALTKAKE